MLRRSADDAVRMRRLAPDLARVSRIPALVRASRHWPSRPARPLTLALAGAGVVTLVTVAAASHASAAALRSPAPEARTTYATALTSVAPYDPPQLTRTISADRPANGFQSSRTAAAAPIGTERGRNVLTNGRVRSFTSWIGTLRTQVVATRPPADAMARHAEAERIFLSKGIAVRSSGGCSDRERPVCTSLEGMRHGTIRGLATFQRDSGCALTVSGGTEVGHAKGRHSHGTGYKIDILLSPCVDRYVQDHYRQLEARGDGAEMYASPGGALYAKESDHWDILYR